MEEIRMKRLHCRLFTLSRPLAFEMALIYIVSPHIYIHDNFVILWVVEYVFHYHVLHKLAFSHRRITTPNQFALVVNAP